MQGLHILPSRTREHPTLPGRQAYRTCPELLTGLSLGGGGALGSAATQVVGGVMKERRGRRPLICDRGTGSVDDSGGAGEN